MSLGDPGGAAGMCPPVLFFDIHIFGLSKERPILDHHPKAHIHEIRRISGVKSISKDQLPGMVSPML